MFSHSEANAINNTFSDGLDLFTFMLVHEKYTNHITLGQPIRFWYKTSGIAHLLISSFLKTMYICIHMTFKGLLSHLCETNYHHSIKALLG